MPEDWHNWTEREYETRSHSNSTVATTESYSAYRPDRSPYEGSTARRRYDASDVVVIPGDGRDRSHYDRTCYREEPTYYGRDPSETRIRSAGPERPSFSSNGHLNGRASHATYESGPGGRSSLVTYENGLGGRTSRSDAETVKGPKSQYAHPDPRNQPDNRFAALEISAARRRRNGAAYLASDRSTVIAEGRADIPVGFSPQVTASHSRAVMEDETDRRASSRFVVEAYGNRRAGSRYVVEDNAERRAGSRFVVEERPDRRQGSQIVVNRPPERIPCYSPHDQAYEREIAHVPYPRRQSSMERVVPPEVDRTGPCKQYVILRDQGGVYTGIERT